MTLGFEITNVDFQLEGQRNYPVGYFNFENTQELRNAEKDFWQGKVVVEPRAFVTNMRGLKANISNVYKNPRKENFDKKS